MLLGAFSAAIYSVFGRPVFGKYGADVCHGAGGRLRPSGASAARDCERRLNGLPHFSANGWIAVIFLGTVGAAIQFSLFTWALRWLPSSRVVIYLTLNPIIGDIAGELMLGEAVTPVLIAGLVFVIAGIVVANWRRRA